MAFATNLLFVVFFKMRFILLETVGLEDMKFKIGVTLCPILAEFVFLWEIDRSE